MHYHILKPIVDNGTTSHVGSEESVLEIMGNYRILAKDCSDDIFIEAKL